MASFFDRVFGRSKPSSSEIAKDRLKFVLIHDRINLPPEKLAEMKNEILAVISKYVKVDTNSVDIALEQADRLGKIVAEIPFEDVKYSPVEETTSQSNDVSVSSDDATKEIDKKSLEDQ